MQEQEDQEESSGSKLSRYKLQQKRGKKAQDLDEYAKFVADKIEELNRLIKDPKTSVEDRKKYRNQKTSYNARLRNRNHTSSITAQLTEKDQEIKQLLQIVTSVVDKDAAARIHSLACEKIPETVQRLQSAFS